MVLSKNSILIIGRDQWSQKSPTMLQRHGIQLAVTLGLTATVGAICSSCSRVVDFSGKVQEVPDERQSRIVRMHKLPDPITRSIEGATVQLFDLKGNLIDSMSSEVDGFFSVADTRTSGSGRNYRLVITKKGYLPIHDTVDFPNDHKLRYLVTLARERTK